MASTTNLQLEKQSAAQAGAIWGADIPENWDKIDQRLARGGLDIMDPRFGAIGSGAVNDGPAIDDAVAALPATGGVVRCPSGLFRVDSSLAWNKDQVIFVGEGANATILKFTGSGTGVDVGDGSAVRNGVEFRSMTIRGNQTAPADGLRLRTCWQANFVGVNFLDFPTYHLRCESGGHIRIVGCQFSQNVAGSATFIRLYNGILYGVVGTTFESANGNETFLEIGGVAQDVHISDCSGAGIHDRDISCLSAADRVSVLGWSSADCTVTGFEFSGGAKDVGIGLCQVKGRGATTTGSAVDLTNAIAPRVAANQFRNWNDPVVRYGSATDVDISHNYIGGLGRPLYDNTGATGIVAFNKIPTGTPTVTGTGVHYFHNIPWQPQGTASITVGASPFTIPAAAYPRAIYIRGGTVSDISKNGRTIFTATNATVYLDAGESGPVITYSAAPTVEEDRK